MLDIFRAQHSHVKEHLYLPFKKVHTYTVLQIDPLLLPLFAFCRKYVLSGTLFITGRFFPRTDAIPTHTPAFTMQAKLAERTG